MNIHILDLVVLIAYFVLMAIIGYLCSKKNTSTEEYFVGGRAFKGWVIGLSLVGTSISSISFLAYPADTFKTSWIRFLPNFVYPVGVFIASKFFLTFFRRKKTTSAYQFLEERFGPSIRVYGTITFIIAQVVRVSIILFLTSIVIHEITGFSTNLCILIAGGCVALYTIVGGIDAVIWTDVVQTIVLVFGGLICMAVVLGKLPGGLGEIIRVGVENSKFSFSELTDGKLVPIPFFGSLKDKTILMMLLAGLAAWLTEYSASQTTIQRYCAAKSEKEARKAMWVCVWSSLPIWAFFMFLGTSLFVFFRAFPTAEAQQMLNGQRQAEQILPFFVMNYLPPGLGGIVIAAALAAAMSSLDSSINAISTVTIVDIYRRHLVKGQTDRHYLKVAWFFASVAGAVMIGGALVLANVKTKTLQDTGMILSSVVAGGMLGIYLLGFFTKVRGSAGIWAGIVATFLFTVWTILSSRNMLPEAISFKYDLYYTIFIGNVVMFFVGFLAHILLSKFFKIKQTSVIDIDNIYE